MDMGVGGSVIRADFDNFLQFHVQGLRSGSLNLETFNEGRNLCRRKWGALKDRNYLDDLLIFADREGLSTALDQIHH